MLLAEVAEASRAVAAVAGRLAKRELLAACLRRAAPDDVPVVVAYLSGELPQRRTGLGHAALRDVPPPSAEPTLTVAEVAAAFDRSAARTGPGSATTRRRELSALLARATADEQRLLVGLIAGELRQGASAGLVTDAVAAAADVPLAAVQAALTRCGSLPAVAQAALQQGAAGLARLRLQVGRPLAPMLAAPGSDLDDALERAAPAAVEWKVDGVRIQVHRDGEQVGVFTRGLEDVTERMPEVVAAARALPVRSVVLDGEAVALRDDGRPLPFQLTASRAARRSGVPLARFYFDLLHLDGDDLLDEPLSVRSDALARVVPEADRVPRCVPGDAAAARAFADAALAAGHEGVVVKSLAAPYAAGRRGAGWLKVKPRHTLDLVVLAAEWGHGRRRGRLSNLHLGARDPAGGFVMLGKTFKGLTDELLAWQTERLLALATAADPWHVVVRPELVVEVAFDGVQTSPRYPGGVALRFARVLRYRDDKPASQADTIDDVLRLRP